MKNNMSYEIAKPLIDWWDNYADYKTTLLNDNELIIEDLQVNEEPYKMTIVERVRNIGDHIIDGFLDTCQIFEDMEYFNKIYNMYKNICLSLNIEYKKVVNV